MNNWKAEHCDPVLWQVPAMLRRFRDRLLASRPRRWATRILLGLFLLFVCPALLGAVANAETGTRTTGSSVGSALGWTHVKDSSGVELSSYMFATDHGSVLHPGNAAVSLVLGLEFAGWKILVTTAIWLIGYALSFQWLNIVSKPLEGVAHSLSGQIATPIMLVTAATIGAFFVAWFVTRGFYAKATMQVVTMVGVAILGPIFLAEPLADVLSSDGLLAQGRDLGISVAAGLNGNGNADPSHTVATMQATLTDNFARRPLQVWNYGHVVDEQPACKSAWSAGMSAGSEDRVKNGINSCGDRVAKESVDNPNFEQIATGLLLLLAGTVLLAFGAVVAIKVIRAALDTIYHGLMSIFGFAAGGFVYGPTQTFLVRNIVDGVIAAARMTAFTIFLGVYVLILGDLFRLAGDQVMVVFVVGAIVMIIAILQLKKLSKSLDKGNEWVANRFALAIQGSGGGRGSGSGSATALGMGTMGAGHSMSKMSMLAALGAVSTVSNSPATEWLWGRTRSPLRPFSRTERRAQLAQWGFWGSPGVGGPKGTYAQAYMHRPLFEMAAREAAEANGGINTVRGAAAAMQAIADVGGKSTDAWVAMDVVGFDDERIRYNAIRSWEIVDGNTKDWTLANSHLGHVVAGVQRVQDSSLRLIAGNSDPGEVAADLATLQAAAFRYRRSVPAGVTLDGGVAGGPEEQLVSAYLAAPTSDVVLDLQRVATGGAATGPLAGTGFANDHLAAQRMMGAIGSRQADLVLTSVNDVLANPTDQQLLRVARGHISDTTITDQALSGAKRTSTNTPTPPAQNSPQRPGWAPALAPVGQVLN
ncbi:hypothetical protein ACQP1G_38845 [Nocardia sp. CA-107356]|uniref:hypothetical protein n=1 Tax=Nocardia sp. CA-107356 TaxID=3239972 RepID=UPI003D89D003